LKVSCLVYLFFLGFLTVAYGQVSDPDMGVLEKSHLPGFIKERKPEVEDLHSRNYYLNYSWQLGSIVLKGGIEISNVLFKYDIIRHILEVKDNLDIYILSVKSVDSFYWLDANNGKKILFQPVDSYYNAPEAIFGFFEVLGTFKSIEDKFELLIHHSVWLYPATSSVSLSGSHKSNDIFWREDFYLSIDGELNKLDRKRKNNYSLFSPYHQEMREFIRKKGLTFRKKEDLTSIFSQYMILVSDTRN